MSSESETNPVIVAARLAESAKAKGVKNAEKQLRSRFCPPTQAEVDEELRRRAELKNNEKGSVCQSPSKTDGPTNQSPQ